VEVQIMSLGVYIEVSYETVDELVLEALKEDYVASVKNSIKHGEWTHPEDIKMYKKLRKALKKVLRYRMVEGDYFTFIEQADSGTYVSNYERKLKQSGGEDWLDL